MSRRGTLRSGSANARPQLGVRRPQLLPLCRSAALSCHKRAQPCTLQLGALNLRIALANSRSCMPPCWRWTQAFSSLSSQGACGRRERDKEVRSDRVVMDTTEVIDALNWLASGRRIDVSCEVLQAESTRCHRVSVKPP